MDVEGKLLSFVRWHGEIPPDAHRITDDEAVMHSASWVRRNLGVGTVSAYVIGFESGESSWTLFFDRIREVSATSVVEVWKIDSYNNRGPSWERRFWYWPDGRWQQVSPRDAAQRKDASQRGAVSFSPKGSTEELAIVRQRLRELQPRRASKT